MVHPSICLQSTWCPQPGHGSIKRPRSQVRSRFGSCNWPRVVPGGKSESRGGGRLASGVLLEVPPQRVDARSGMLVDKLPRPEEAELRDSLDLPLLHHCHRLFVGIPVYLQKRGVLELLAHRAELWPHHLTRPAAGGADVQHHQRLARLRQRFREVVLALDHGHLSHSHVGLHCLYAHGRRQPGRRTLARRGETRRWSGDASAADVRAGVWESCNAASHGGRRG
mmetsp:Transcript_4694/g.13023  ORF Transcript_4694/g.13023 Transcript_4694/m.13023 type:complete len:224 (+) Transcript_4694:325-996(+)